jgi:glycosyltransferase involved in cell wall biosynthesis
LLKTFPNWSLVFVGKGDALHRLRSFVASKRMLHRVEFCDPVPHNQIATMLQKMSLLVLPSYDTSSWREQFGHVIIEAMACGIPVVSTNCPTGPGEIIEPMKNGMLVPVGDDQAMADAIIYILNNPQTAEGFSMQGKKTAEYFSVAKSVGEYERLFTKLVI